MTLSVTLDCGNTDTVGKIEQAFQNVVFIRADLDWVKGAKVSFRIQTAQPQEPAAAHHAGIEHTGSIAGTLRVRDVFENIPGHTPLVRCVVAPMTLRNRDVLKAILHDAGFADFGASESDVQDLSIQSWEIDSSLDADPDTQQRNIFSSALRERVNKLRNSRNS